MKHIVGDLIALANEGKFDVIIHGCNCFRKMGAGIALAIKGEFPAAYFADQMTKHGDKSKLGTYSSAVLEKIVVVNAYTQYDYRRSSQPNVSYPAIREVFKKIKKEFSGKRIGYPKIGAGLAGGDWNIISKIIDEELEGEDHTFVEFIGEQK